MIIERREIKQYPHNGKFFKIVIVQESPLDPPIKKEIILYQGECDIQQSGAMSTPMLTKAGYAIYFTLGEDENGDYELNIQKGSSFDGDMYGQRVNGRVLGIFPSQLGGVVAYVEDTDIE